MKNLNHAKVIQAVDKAVQGKREEFVFEFLKGYGIPAATIKRLKMGDKSRNLAQKEGDLALDKVIRKYPKDKLGILLVTLDTNSDELRSQLVKDSIAWNIVTDSAGQAIRLIDLYNVSVLPRCFLIDENHKIILKTENDLELEQALENIFEEE